MGDILVVEDNEADRHLLRETFPQPARLSFANDGLEAIDYLTHAPRPRLILLDLNLPKCSGRRVLDVIKRNPEYRGIPVIIFTSSVAEEDVRQCYEAHANCYITKPNELDDYLRIIRYIERFWLRTAELPSGTFVDLAVESKKLH